MKIARFFAIAVCLGIISFGLTSAAYAQAPPVNLETCDAGASFLPSDITAKVVYCVQNTIIRAVSIILAAVSNYLTDTIGLAFVLALIVFAVRILGGENEIRPKAIAFLIRLGLVWMFSFGLAGIGGYLFDIMQELTRLAAGGFSPWARIDTFLGRLFGYAPGLLLSQGVLWLMAGLFSGAAAATMSLGLVMTILNLLWFVFDVVYTYLTAIVIVGFLLILSPIIIPLALFQYTERYFKRWTEVLIAAIITPMLLFAFLAMFLSIFDVLIGNIFTTLGNNDYQPFWRVQQPACAWQIPTDPNLNRQLGDVNVDIQPQQNIPPAQVNINPFGQGLNLCSFTFPGIDFGSQNLQILQSLIFNLLALWLFTSILKSTIHKIPEVASSIAGAASGVAMPTESFKDRMQDTMSGALVGAGAVAGGMGGTAVGGAIGGTRGVAARQLGAMIGVLAGGSLGGSVSDAIAQGGGQAGEDVLPLHREVVVILPNGHREHGEIVGHGVSNGVTSYNIRLHNGEEMLHVPRNRILTS